MEASGELFWGLLGPVLGLLGASWGPLGVSWGFLGASWGGKLDFLVRGPPIGPVLGRSWAVLGASWADLGASWGALGGLLGASWALLRASKSDSKTMLKTRPPPEPKNVKNTVFFNDFGPPGGNLTGQEREAPLLPTELVGERLVEAAEEEDKEGAVRVVCASG